MTCKCGNEKCHGFQLLHEKELEELDERKELLKARYGNVDFELKRSPSSGEIFTKFYDLHVVSQ
jgi:hypothetical protein